MSPKDRLIVALDVDTKSRALSLAGALKDDVGFFKIGLELFSSCGPDIVRQISGLGCKVFLDLKFHDIPTTVSKAAVSVTGLGAYMFNVHALGGYDMMKRCGDAVKAEAERLKVARPKVIAVTVLTSMDQASLGKVGVSCNIKEEVVKLARLAKDAGLDGVVASPEEARMIRDDAGDDFIIVTPGVRPSWAAADDQKRIATPKSAIADGASFIVVGRPITAAADPVEAAKKILQEIGDS
ncbi:MAG TPA: orotidine-5'-phosphate decarboxylase [Candidatus Omnitrophota bacterium]|nr:orotidine-5'-phosphate decarboxylase [Candidatus Omnitrophota bacterium]